MHTGVCNDEYIAQGFLFRQVASNSAVPPVYFYARELIFKQSYMDKTLSFFEKYGGKGLLNFGKRPIEESVLLKNNRIGITNHPNCLR